MLIIIRRITLFMRVFIYYSVNLTILFIIEKEEALRSAVNKKDFLLWFGYGFIIMQKNHINC